MNSTGKVAAGVLGFAIGLFAGRLFHGDAAGPSYAGQTAPNENSKLLAKIDDDVSRLLSALGADGDTTTDDADQVAIHSVDDAKALLQSMEEMPTAEKMATLAATLDTWSFDPADEKSVQDVKTDLLARLRSAVKTEVSSLHEKALNAANGGEAGKLHSEAGRTLALYPMSDEKSVLEEAQQLSAHQVAVAARVEAIRRQRYNLWATHQIEAAINGYNGNKSYWSPLKENALLVDSLVTSLGEVDPMLLEPVVLELYNYVIDLTKGSISEKDKLQLATRLSDPSIRRKGLGDF